MTPRREPSADGWSQDVLGPDYQALTLELADDDEGPVVATLVRYRPPVPEPVRPARAVLYVHGWNDYFFQTGLAEYWHGQGAAFYALDLRKYGRSLRPHHTPNYVADLAEYDEELDAAILRIRHDLGTRARIMLMGHSTGGLVGSLWAHRHPGSVSGLVLNFVPDPVAALREAGRTARPGATIAAYVWDYAGEMQLIRRFWDGAVALDPGAAGLDEGVRFPICAPGPLRRVFEGAGLTSVSVRAIDVPTTFATFDDYWSPFLTGVGPAPGYASALDDASRDRLREHLRTTLPVEPDGSINLVARAWAVRGDAPGGPS